jgi:Tat protein translocase TatB subunit
MTNMIFSASATLFASSLTMPSCSHIAEGRNVIASRTKGRTFSAFINISTISTFSSISFYFPSSPPVKALFAPDLQVKLFIAPHLCYLYGMFGIGLPELVIIIIVALLVVGPARLPEVARSLGKALGEFRRLADDVKETIEREMTAEEEKKAEPGGQKEEEKEQPGAIGEKEEEKETPETQEEGPAGVGPPPGKGPEGLEKEPPEGTSPDERQKQV